jgi:hypothetical protein
VTYSATSTIRSKNLHKQISTLLREVDYQVTYAVPKKNTVKGVRLFLIEEVLP